MKQWQETAAILARLQQLRGRGEDAAIACVVAISGSAYRRPGARFLIAADGSTLGGISGGCLEEDVRRNGRQAIADGRCRLLHYETGENDDPLWGLGLGCNGAVDVFLTPTSRPGFDTAAAALRSMLDGERGFTVASLLGDGDERLQGRMRVFGGGEAGGGGGEAYAEGREAHAGGGEALAADSASGNEADPGPQVGAAESASGNNDDPGRHVGAAGGASGDESALGSQVDAALSAAAAAVSASGNSRCVDTDAGRVFVDVFTPPPILVVCGAGDDAMAIVAAAADVGFRVVVVDHRRGYLSNERFPDAWRLVRSSPENNADGIPTSAATFVLLKTHNIERDKAWARRFGAQPITYLGLLGPGARCEEVAAAARGLDARRIFGPVGVDIGAEGPEQIGVAVVAELLAVRAARDAGHLRDRQAPIHDPD